MTPSPGARQPRRWRLRHNPVAGALSDTAFPPLVQRLLENRGVATLSQARAFFDGKTDGDPFSLPDMEKAVARLRQASLTGETVAVFGDFDVDGVTSVALLTEGLRSLGALVIPYIPDRFGEGYGLNSPAITRLHEQGATLLVAVDCGTSSLDEVAHARSLGMDAVIIDHHLPLSELPAALAIVNPKLASPPDAAVDCAAAGLAYHVLRALFDSLRRPFEEERFLDLAALGTVVDMAPVIGPNRMLVRRGLDAIARTERPGLRALLAASGVQGPVDTETLSFMLGPRLNAAGRIAHARLSLDLLLCDEPDAARQMAQQLSSLNRERQRQTAAAVELAWSLLGEDIDAPLLMIGHGEVPAGVAGLVASKLVDTVYRPAVVYQRGEATSRASGRSIPEFDLAAALRDCGDLFQRFGGHRQAAGFTADNERLPAIKEALTACAAERLAGVDLMPTIDVDAEVALQGIGGEEIRWLARLAPHGVGNPEPVLLSRDVLVVERRTVGSDGKHLRLKLRDGPVVWPAIAFGLGEAAVAERQRIDVVYSLSADRRDGGLQLLVRDLAPSA